MIVCIGDSITFGQHLAPGEKPWPALVEGHDLVAAGVPSDTTRLGLERFPTDVQALTPEAVVIQFGHNDCNRWDTDRGLPRVSPQAYHANLVEMIERSLHFGAEPFLCSLTPSTRSEQHATDVGTYDGIVREVTATLGVVLIDVRTRFGDHQDAGLLLDDGLHLSAAGHRLYAETVQLALDAWSAAA